LTSLTDEALTISDEGRMFYKTATWQLLPAMRRLHRM